MRTTVLTAIGVTLAMGWHIGMAQVVAPTKPLNDTGMRKCLNAATNTFSNVCSGANVPPGQDGRYGRDKTVPTAMDGPLGFSFTKVCHSGELAGTGNCPKNPKLGSQLNKWGCTKDNVTGLVWEINKAESGLRGISNSYNNLGGGEAGSASGFVNAVNAVKLCGANDWRLPTVTELQSIANYSVSGVIDEFTGQFIGGVIGQNWFPNLPQQTSYWTTDGRAGDASRAWFFHFDGSVYPATRDFGGSVLLVRAGR